MERFPVVIVGAGAAGLLAAAKIGPGALLADANPKPGKKLLATGNGRCNLTNLHIAPAFYHGDAEAAAPLLAAFPASRVREAFAALGLLTRADGEGRCYPRSLQAAAVLRALWGACEERGVVPRWDFPVTQILPQGEGFLVRSAGGEEIAARQVILATGGKAALGHGGGRSYALARSLGHTVTELSPSLVPLKTDPARTRPLKGQRCRARAALVRDGAELAAESGEVLFGEGQLSGICVMNLSARLREAGYAPGQPGWAVVLDPLEDWPEPQLFRHFLALRESRPALPARELLAGAVNLRLGAEIAKGLGWQSDALLGDLPDAALKKAARAAKSVAFPVLGRGSWEQAQVTAGGVPLAEVDPVTLESRVCPGLYLLGELLDLDGDCGGFNLHWAWATALAAGEAINGRTRPC